MHSLKVPYEVLAMEVDRLYQKEFPVDALSQIEKHCEYIATFIKACGWTEQDYLNEYLRRGMVEFRGN